MGPGFELSRESNDDDDHIYSCGLHLIRDATGSRYVMLDVKKATAMPKFLASSAFSYGTASVVD
jgi:hypothetical protein